jgi:hypothetical protein
MFPVLRLINRPIHPNVQLALLFPWRVTAELCDTYAARKPKPRSAMECAGDYNHALELDTRKKGSNIHSSRRFNSAHCSPTRADGMGSIKAAVSSSGEREHGKQPDCKVLESRNSQDDLIKAAHGPKDRSHTPNDSFLRSSACGSTESNCGQLAPDKSCKTEAVIEVLKPWKKDQPSDAARDPLSQQELDRRDTVSPSAGEGWAQTRIAESLAAGYSNRKKV